MFLLPWFVRNFFIFGDIGLGLFLPFSNKISQFFYIFLPSKDFNFIAAGTNGFVPTEGIKYSLTQLTKLSFFNDAFSITFLLFFILAFVGLAFFNFHISKKSLFKQLITVIGIFGIYYFIFTYTVSQLYLQIFFLFIMPPFVIYFLYKKKKNWFTKQIPTFFYFTVIYSFFQLIGMYYVASVAGWEVLGSRFLIFAIIMLVPLSLIGCEKIIQHLPFPKNKEKRNTLVFIILVITISPIIIQNLDSSEYQKNYPKILENSDIKQLNSFIQNNVQSDKIIASNFPANTWFRTGIDSISLPTFITNQDTFEKYIDYFHISYLVIYENLDHRYKSENLPEKIMSYLPLNYVYILHPIGNSFIIEIKDVLETDISNPEGYFAKAQKLERLGRIDEAKKIFHELKNYDSDPKITEKICEMYTSYQLYEESIYKCNMVLQNNSANLIALYNLAVSYDGNEQKENVLKIISRYDALLTNSYSEQLIKFWVKTINYLIQQDDFYKQIITDRFDNAKKLAEQDDLESSLKIFQQLSRIDYLKIESMESQIPILIKLEKYENALEMYDQTYEIYLSEIDNLHNTSQNDKANKMQKSMINLLKTKATLLTSLEDYHKANSVYLEILSIDRTNLDAYKEIAAYYEKYGNLKTSLQNYEMALRFEPDNDYLLEKIKELKDKIDD